MLLWSIHKHRNSLIFQNAVPNPTYTLIRAKLAWAEWKQQCCSPFLPPSFPKPQLLYSPTSTQIIRWIPPPDGVLKLNFDGRLLIAGAAAGYILRDASGRLIIAATRFLHDVSILVAEAVALRDGLQATIDTGLPHLQIEGDNRIVIQAVKGEIRTPWRTHILVQDIRNVLSRFMSPSIQHVFREGNMTANWIAKLGVLLKTDTIFTLCITS